MGELRLNHRPLTLPESSANPKNSLFVETCPKERTAEKDRNSPCQNASRVNCQPRVIQNQTKLIIFLTQLPDGLPAFAYKAAPAPSPSSGPRPSSDFQLPLQSLHDPGFYFSFSCADHAISCTSSIFKSYSPAPETGSWPKQNSSPCLVFMLPFPAGCHSPLQKPILFSNSKLNPRLHLKEQRSKFKTHTNWTRIFLFQNCSGILPQTWA